MIQMNSSFFDFFMSAALAQAQAPAGKGPSMFEQMLLPVGLIAIFYFFMMRPQIKKAKAQQQLLTNLKVGDEVVTTGGLIGKVRSIAEGFLTLELSQGATAKILKNNVTHLTKDLVLNSASAKEGSGKDKEKDVEKLPKPAR